MDNIKLQNIRRQLFDRKEKLSDTIGYNKEDYNLISLLNEVNTALEKMERGTYGICEVCHEPIEEERLLVDPLIKVCLGDLNEKQQRVLEQDLQLASQMQRALLPKKNISTNDWEIDFTYLPAGPVSGDYCDLINLDNGEILFVLGDVSGKGIAASLLMTQIHAIFHSLTHYEISLEKLLVRVNRLICESNSYSHFITLICGKLKRNGEMEIINAGHCLPIVQKQTLINNINSTTLPLGIFCDMEYNIQKLILDKNDSLILYTDGLSEARRNEEEYGNHRINEIVLKNGNKSPNDLINVFVNDVDDFTNGEKMIDDLTIMVIKRLT